ncbi:SDR family NAD(P)-dependent oxidoreductase [Shouchella hunanensis]|uniref:SDR family NAD(P)-dependent oxidoreductase n=1 Tax=Shouchella hunanensis TaxID=766894 RepID=A0ABY7VZ86_9BACI|nr:SDR family NAD(P)-dependent oxidoreductase [Shouchella hunanensis]WDF02033.1 SDR family NAD(P)-dependent oxidoreductase [Shouchella hunanensis]
MKTPTINLEDLNLNNLFQTNSKDNSNSIAVIGMDGRVGQAENLSDFWSMLVDEQEFNKELPVSRKVDIESYLKLSGVQVPLGEEDYIKTTFMNDIAGFDYKFFGISKKEANYMDPNQRILLETTWKALEDAGYGGESIKGSNTGVYIGHSSDFGNDYRSITRVLSSNEEVEISGNVKSMMASRLSYYLNLNGPALVVDTACSSGLVALLTACRSLQSGDCSMAVVGGVNTDIIPVVDRDFGVGIRDINEINSKDGKTRTFDNSSDGTCAAEGAFAFVLKPFEEAIKDKDNVRAVIKGGAINQDGASNGITSPNSEAQGNLIIKAIEKASISAEDISYFEAHGTATKLGDPIEIDGIQRAMSFFTNKKQFCGVGSLKSNIGHLDNVAGLGGLAKVILAMSYRTLPATLNFNTPNVNIPFINSPVYVHDSNRNWGEDSAQILIAGVSSFGLSGTNCHLILQSPSIDFEETFSNEMFLLLPISAKSFKALRELVKSYINLLDNTKVNIHDLVYTASVGRFHHNIRLAIPFKEENQLLKDLKRFIETPIESAYQEFICNEHRIVSENKLKKRTGDLTEIEQSQISRYADNSLLLGLQNESEIEAIAKHYVRGANISWTALLKNINAKKVPLPTYPFQHEKCWVNLTGYSSIKYKNKDDYSVVHSSHELILSWELNPKRDWELSGHKINGQCVMPGTGYIEMVTKLIKNQLHENRNAKLERVLFIEPFIVSNDETRTLNLIVDKKGIQKSFTFSSNDTDGTNQKTHATGYIIFDEKDQIAINKKIDLNELKKSLTFPAIIYNEDDTKNGLVVDKRWSRSFVKGLKDSSSSEFLMTFSLPNQFHEEIDLYNLHPALMDMAVNAANNFMNEEEFHLPLSYGEIKIYKSLPKNIISYIKKIDVKGPEIHKFNIMLCDLSGNTLVDIKDYCIKSTSQSDNFGKSKFGYTNIFMNYSSPEKLVHRTGTIAIIGKKSVTTVEASKQLLKLGYKVIEVYEKDDWDQALKTLREINLSFALFNWHIDSNSEKEYIKEPLNQSFSFIKSWIKSKIKPKYGLAILLNNSCVVNQFDEVINPEQTALNGFWLSVGKENAHLKIKCIDFDDNTSFSRIADEICSNNRPGLVAYRKNEAFISQIQRSPLPPLDNKLTQMNLDGIFVITGGTGALGLTLTKALIKKGVKKIVLLGNTEYPIKKDWKSYNPKLNDIITEKMNLFIEFDEKLDLFEVSALDLSDYNKVNQFLNKLRIRYGKIQGIFHLAGKAGDGFIHNKDRSNFDLVVNPKMLGSFNLHRATSSDNLDFFVLFSSISSLIVQPGQSDYTAANMFMDSLSYLRGMKNLPSLSIQWPAWREIGMAFNYGAVDEDEEFPPLNVEQCLSILDKLLWSSENIPAVIMPGTRQFQEKNNEPDFSLDSQIDTLGSIDEVEHIVKIIWSKTLEINNVDLDDDFSSLGGNSLLTTQMLRGFEQYFPGVIDISDLFSYTTISEQTKYIKSKLEKEHNKSEGVNKINRTIDEIDVNTLDNLLEQVSHGKIGIQDSTSYLANKKLR